MTNKQFVKSIYPTANCYGIKAFSIWIDGFRAISSFHKTPNAAWKNAAEIIRLKISDKLES